MNYFTPELYIRGNSPDDRVADRAEADWEDALRAYRRDLDAHVGVMNDRVAGLARDLCLHDAELLSLRADVPGPLVPSLLARPLRVATITLGTPAGIVSLMYFLWGAVEQGEPGCPWPFSKSRTHWLYDEVEVEARPPYPPLYRHRILWSDGGVTSIPFFDVIVQSFPERRPEAAGAEIQTV